MQQAEAAQAATALAVESAKAELRASMEREMREKLAAEQEKRDEERRCPICLDADKDCAFNCGHQTCMRCGDSLSRCPVCRAPIIARTKVY